LKSDEEICPGCIQFLTLHQTQCSMKILISVILVLSMACRKHPNGEVSLPLKPFNQENLEGSWASKPEAPAEIRFHGDSIMFIEDQQAFAYMITGDSIQFEFEYATFWYRIELRGDDQMRMYSPHMSIAYVRVKEQ